MEALPAAAAGTMGATPSANLRVRGLPSGTSEEQMKSIFVQYGALVSAVLTAPPGSPDATAFVRMSSLEDAQRVTNNAAAIAYDLGVPLQITFAPHEGAGRAPALPTSSSTLEIKDLPLRILDEQLSTILAVYGEVVSCKVLPRLSGASSAAAIVEMANLDQAQWMVDILDGNTPQGLSSPVIVKFKTVDIRGGSTPEGLASPTVVKFEPEGPAPQRTYQGCGGDRGGATLPMAAKTSGGDTQTAMWTRLQNGQPSEYICLSGFPMGTSVERLMSIIGSQGAVISCKVFPPSPGKGDVAFFVRMRSVWEAQWLVQNANGAIPHGMARPISICFAEWPRRQPGEPYTSVAPPPPLALAAPAANYNPLARRQAPLDPRGREGPETAAFQDLKVFVGGLPRDMHEDSLFEYFRSLGLRVKSVNLPRPRTHACPNRGFGFATFEDRESYDYILAGGNARFLEMGSKVIEVKRAEWPKELQDPGRGMQLQAGISVDAASYAGNERVPAAAPAPASASSSSASTSKVMERDLVCNITDQRFVFMRF